MEQFLIIHDGVQCDISVSSFGVAEQGIDENSGTITKLAIVCFHYAEQNQGNCFSSCKDLICSISPSKC